MNKRTAKSLQKGYSIHALSKDHESVPNLRIIN